MAMWRNVTNAICLDIHKLLHTIKVALINYIFGGGLDWTCEIPSYNYSSVVLMITQTKLYIHRYVHELILNSFSGLPVFCSSKYYLSHLMLPSIIMSEIQNTIDVYVFVCMKVRGPGFASPPFPVLQFS